MGSDEQTYDPRDYPPFAVTVDLVILTVREGRLCALLLERSEPPHQGQLALPGGFVAPETDLVDAARDTLAAKTGVEVAPIHLEQLRTYGAPGRDPRMRVVSVAYLALAANLPDPVPGPEATSAGWIPMGVNETRELAFDHETILLDGIERARSRLEYTTLAACFCDAEFTMGELRSIYEAVWGVSLDPANFDRKIRATLDFVVPTGGSRQPAKGRPARTYRRGKATDLLPPIRRG